VMIVLTPLAPGLAHERAGLLLSWVGDLVEQQGAGENVAMNERTGAQLRVIKTVTNVLRAVDISAWLFGGWGLDARIGRITRDHGDIEFWLERVDAERSKAVLIGAGAAALATQPAPAGGVGPWFAPGRRRERSAHRDGLVVGVGVNGHEAKLAAHDYSSLTDTERITSPWRISPTTSMPLTTCPKRLYALASLWRLSTVQMKNCEPLVSGPALAHAPAPAISLP